MQNQRMPTSRPSYSINDIIRQLMGFDNSPVVVMTRDFAADVIDELERLYAIEDAYNDGESETKKTN